MPGGIFMFSAGGCGCTSGAPNLVGCVDCLPCVMPRQDINVTISGPGGTITGVIVYSTINGADSWVSGCLTLPGVDPAYGMILSMSCPNYSGANINVCVTYFISGGCPSGQSLSCCSETGELTLVAFTCIPFHLHYTLTDASCPALAGGGFYDIVLDAPGFVGCVCSGLCSACGGVGFAVNGTWSDDINSGPLYLYDGPLYQSDTVRWPGQPVEIDFGGGTCGQMVPDPINDWPGTISYYYTVECTQGPDLQITFWSMYSYCLDDQGIWHATLAAIDPVSGAGISYTTTATPTCDGGVMSATFTLPAMLMTGVGVLVPMPTTSVSIRIPVNPGSDYECCKPLGGTSSCPMPRADLIMTNQFNGEITLLHYAPGYLTNQPSMDWHSDCFAFFGVNARYVFGCLINGSGPSLAIQYFYSHIDGSPLPCTPDFEFTIDANAGAVFDALPGGTCIPLVMPFGVYDSGSDTYSVNWLITPA